MRKYNDLAGLKFGTLTVIERTKDRLYCYPKFQTTKIMYKCLCNCGKMIIRSYEYLKTKKICSCSTECRRLTIKNLIGNQINDLLVVDGPISKKEKDGSLYWTCLCKCGTKLDIRNSRLLSNSAKSCQKCASIKTIQKFNSEKRIPYNKLPFGEASFNSLYHRYTYNAKLNKNDFLLTKEQFKFITSNKCNYCDNLPNKQFPSNETIHKLNELGKRINGCYIYNGIDRLDNTKGYTIENSVSCCEDCNYIKSDWNIDDLKIHLEKMLKKLNQGIK